MKQYIDTIELFPALNQKLIAFLKCLAPEEWNTQTIARKWRIKDVASHLLDGNYRRIALHRDGWFPAPDWPIENYRDLVQYLNQLNADWILATKRLSPGIIIELLESTNDQVYKIFKDLDPFGKAIYPVAWAGQKDSPIWFDIAREYTERWLHQQQIRDAMGDDAIMIKELYYPFLDVFMQALPFAYRNVESEEGTVIKFTILGPGDGKWFLRKTGNQWELIESCGDNFKSETIIDGNVAWKLFSGSIHNKNLNGAVEITGDRALGEKILDMLSVMA